MADSKKTCSGCQSEDLNDPIDSKINLLSPLKILDVTLRNRIVVSPMCQYSSLDGFASDWHLVHLGSRAVGGAGLVFTEAAAITPEGRISPQDLGIWDDKHISFLSRIVSFIHSQGAAAGIQIAHAGRKASTAPPWEGGSPISPSNGGWIPIAPSALPFSDESPTPKMMEHSDIQHVISSFVEAAKRSLSAGFDIIEIHSAHGYLLHEFLSPLSNHRTDSYGGSFDNRTRLLCEVVSEVKKVIPPSMPLFVRISATDWAEGGWEIKQSVDLAKKLKALGVSLIDVSSGALVPHVKIPIGANYQVPFAETIRKEANILTGAVGLITEANQANDIIMTDEADLIFVAREFLREPYWGLKAAQAFDSDELWPHQYKYAVRRSKGK